MSVTYDEDEEAKAFAEVFSESHPDGPAATFSPAEWPDLFQPSQIQYVSVPASEFEKRGLLGKEWHLFRAWAEKLELHPKHCWVAGGFFERILNGQKPNDVDLFFPNFNKFKEQFELMSDRRMKKPFMVGQKYGEEGKVPYDDWKKAEAYIVAKECRFVEAEFDGVKCQLIKAWFNPTPADTIDRFDLTVSQFAFDGENIIFNPLALNDVLSKKLVLHRLHLPTSTFRRIMKYKERGYEVCGGFIVQFMKNSVLVGSKNPQTLEQTYLYVD